MKAFAAGLVAALVFAGAAAAQDVPRSSRRGMSDEARANATAAAAILQRTAANNQAACDGGDQAACRTAAQARQVDGRLYELFETCAAGNRADCDLYDRTTADIVAAAVDNGTGGGK